MKKEMSVPSASVMIRLSMLIASVGETFATLFSRVMEEPVSVRQSWCILHVVAVLLLLVFAALPAVLHFAMCGWLLYALRECRRAGMH